MIIYYPGIGNSTYIQCLGLRTGAEHACMRPVEEDGGRRTQESLLECQEKGHAISVGIIYLHWEPEEVEKGGGVDVTHHYVFLEVFHWVCVMTMLATHIILNRSPVITCLSWCVRDACCVL